MIASPGFGSCLETVCATIRQAPRTLGARNEARHDRELVRRFKAEGDKAAFAEIMERYRERMFSVAFGVLKSNADAEEIAQDVFIRAHRGLANFRGDSSLGTWLHQIALNLARNRYWYHHRRRRHLTRSLDCAFSADIPSSLSDLIASDEAGPVREALVNEFSSMVTTCMGQLSGHAREILTLRNSLNRSYEEIAKELGIGIGTVKSRIARARKNLRARLAETCPEFGPDAVPQAWFGAVRPPLCGVAMLRA
ncbi:MAG: sigma-70 family RNA polymerase sigma factor [Opitutaceae bacterium]|nr:sigma-70 family RNA polymerase sigma factor [Opitutaceae bacterium]